MRELYVMALYATRPSGGEGAAVDYEVALRVALVVAHGEAEARARAMSRLLETCPPEEAWVNHHVTASAIDREQLQGVLEALSDDSSSTDEASGAEELIM